MVPLGPLTPGTYALECDQDLTQEHAERIRAQWEAAAPDTKVIVLGRGIRVVRPQEETHD